MTMTTKSANRNANFENSVGGNRATHLLTNFQNALHLCSVPTLKKDKNMANIIKGSVVSVDTGKKATTGKGVVQSINTATDMIKVKLDSGTVATVDSSDVTLFKNKPAAATSKKPAAAAKPAPKRRAAPAVEEPEADEIVKGSTVSFTDDDENEITGEVIALLPNDRAKVKDSDGNIYKVDVSDLTLEEPEAEEADADAAADAEGETEIVKGSEVSWTDDDGDDQTGKVFKIADAIAHIKTDDGTKWEVDIDELSLVEEQEAAPAKRGRKVAEKPAAKTTVGKNAAKSAPAKRTRKIADEEAELTAKGALNEVIMAAEDFLQAFIDKPQARTRDKVVNAIAAALSAYAGMA
jgi:preprotein translocase subunit YajC